MTSFSFDLPAELTIRADGAEWHVQTGEFNEASVQALLLQGITIILQRSTAGMSENSPSERHTKIGKVIAAIQTNSYEYGGGGGGKRLSEEEHELRLIVVGKLTQAGWKLTEARTKVAKDLEGVVSDYLAIAAKAQGKELTDEQLDTLVERNLDKWAAMAAENVAARKRDTEIELDV